MTKTTRARPDSPLPDADLSVNHMNQIHECLPQSLRHEILKTAVDAKALAWLLLEVVDNRRRQRDALQELLWRETSTVDNGGDLLNEVAAHTCLTTTEEVLVGLHFVLKDDIDSMWHPPGDPQEAVRQHAADHIMETGEPILLLDETSPCPHAEHQGGGRGGGSCRSDCRR